MYDVLRDEGILILTQGTTDKQWKEKPRFIPVVNTRDLSRLFVVDYFEQGARYNILDLVHTDNTSDFKSWYVEYPKMFLKDDYEGFLKATGFTSIHFYGSYDLEENMIKKPATGSSWLHKNNIIHVITGENDYGIGTFDTGAENTSETFVPQGALRSE